MTQPCSYNTCHISSSGMAHTCITHRGDKGHHLEDASFSRALSTRAEDGASAAAAREFSEESAPSSSTMVSRVASWTCRLVPAMNRHGATAENGALRDRGELRATSKKKEANCTPAIVLELWLVVAPRRREDLYREEVMSMHSNHGFYISSAKPSPYFCKTILGRVKTRGGLLEAIKGRFGGVQGVLFQIVTKYGGSCGCQNEQLTKPSLVSIMIWECCWFYLQNSHQRFEEFQH